MSSIGLFQFFRTIPVILGLVYFPQPAVANCDPPPMSTMLGFEGAGSIENMAEAIKKSEASPFVRACKHPGALDLRPTTHLFKFGMPADSKNGARTPDFFKKVIANVEARLNENRNMAIRLLSCVKDRAPGERCDGIRKWASETVPKHVANARFHLALAQAPELSEGITGLHASRALNSSLNPLGTYRARNWEKLTVSEKQEFYPTLESYIKDTRAELDRRVQRGELSKKYARMFENLAIRKVRAQHFEKYSQLSHQFLFMQHLTSPHPTEADIIGAANSLLGSMTEEFGFVDRMKEKLKKSEQTGVMDTGLYQLMNYHSQVEDALLDSPEYCGLASSIVFSEQHANHRMLVPGLLLMGASFFVTPWITIPAGIGLGLNAAFDSHVKYYMADRQVRTQFHSDPGTDDLASAQAAYRQRNIDVATLPIGMGVVGGAGRIVKGTIRVFRGPVMQTGVNVEREFQQGLGLLKDAPK